LDGHNRYIACKNLGIQPIYETRNLPNREEEVLFILECNFNRRNLNDFQKVEKVVLYREPIETKRAEKRKLRGLTQGNRSPMAQIRTYEVTGRVRKLLAPFAGVGETTYYEASWLVKNASESMKQKLRESRVSIDAAYSSLRRQSPKKEQLYFKGTTFKTDFGASLIHGRPGEIDRRTIPYKSIDLIFPTCDCSSDSRMTKEIAEFASSRLRQGGFLVLYSRHDSVGKIDNVLAKRARDLDLVHVMSASFDPAWLNVEGEPVIGTNTAVFLVYWKRVKGDLSDHLAPCFEGPVLIDGEPAEDNEEKLIRPLEANFYIVDYLLETLRLGDGAVVCDPTCKYVEVAIAMANHGCKIICIEEELSRWKHAKEVFENLRQEQNIEDNADSIAVTPAG